MFGEPESTTASTLAKYGVTLGTTPEKPFEKADAENPTVDEKTALGAGPVTDEEYARQMERRATLGSLRRKRQLDADFLRDIADPSVASDNAKLFERCNQYVSDRYVSSHNNGNVLNDMQPFTDAQAYASTLTALIKEGGDPAAISTEQFRAVRDAYAAGDREELMRVLGISKTKWQSVKAGPVTTVPLSVDKTQEELDGEIADGVSRVMSQNYLHLYNAMRPDLTAKGAWLVDKTIRTGKFDPDDMATFLEIERNDKEEGRAVKFLIQAARPAKQNWWVDTAYQTWYLAKDMLEGAFEQLGRPMQALLDADVVSDLHREAVMAHSQRVDGGMDEKESMRILNSEIAEIHAESLLEPRKRAELRREKLVLDEFTRHKSWEGYNWLQRSLTGAVTTLPYMGATAITGAGFVVNVASHLQDVEDDIIREGGDPEKAKAFRLVSAVAWAGIEKMQFEGFFGKALTRMEKRALWLEGSRRAYGQLAKSYGKEWTAKEISETVEEGLQGGIQALETDLGLVGDPDPKKRKDFDAIVGDVIGGIVNDMKESAGSMGILALVGTGKAVYQESRRQYRAGIDGESRKEFFKRRDLVDTVIDGSWAEGDGDKVERRKEVFNKLIDLWAKAGQEKTPVGEVAAQIEEQFGFSEDQAKSVVNFLEAKDTITEMAVGMFKGAVDPQAKAQEWVDQKLAGGEFQFIVGNDGTFDVGRLFQFFPGVEVETVDVDADGKPIAATDEAEQPAFEEDARLAGLREELVRLEKAIAEAPNRKARRPLEIQHRKVERKIRDIERQDEQKKAERKPVEKPKAVGQRIRITQTIKDADGKDVKKTWELMLDNSVPDITAPDFATSVANEAVRTGMPVEYNGGQTVITADNQAAFTDWLRDFIATDKELATSWLKAHGFQTGGNFAPETDASKGIVGTIRLMRGSSPLVAKGGNYTLSHEFFHAFTAAADQMGLLTDDLVGTFRQLFGDPRGTEEKFNEEAAADAFRDWLRGELDFSHIAEDRRGLVEKLIDGIFGAFRDIFAAVTGKKPLTPSEKVTLRDAQIAAFEAVRNGDLRGMSKFAGIDFAEDRKKAEKAKTDAEAKAKKAEEDAKRGKSGPTVGFRRKGVKPPEDASAGEEVPTVEPTAAAAEAVASAAPGSVPVRTGSKRKVFTPGYGMEVDTELAWVSLDDLIESDDDREIQMRDRSRRSSDEQVHNISKPRRRKADGTYEGFTPKGVLPSDMSDLGAPIIGGGQRIISGHGRYRVLKALAQAGRFGEYLAAAQQYATDAGIAQAPAGMRNPVLVHRITSMLSREQLVKFAFLSNKSGLLQMSIAGDAEQDARKLTPNLMRLYNPGASGNLMAASNRPFMHKFLADVGAEHMYDTADGTGLLTEAAVRVQRALMVALFGNDEAVRPIMQYLIENASEFSLGTLTRTLMVNAGQLLAMKGQHGSLSIVPAVASAAKLYVAWRAAQSSSPNMSFSDYLHTDDLFEAHASPLDTAVALLLETPYFDRVLRKYGELVANEAADNQGLLGIAGTERHSSVQLLAMAERAVVEKDAAGNPVTPYVTLDPADPSYALEEQTPPAVSAAPEPTPEPEPTPAPEQSETPAPVQSAATVLNPPTDVPFEPTEVARGTAQLPNRNAQGIRAHQVNAEGNPTTTPRQLPAGAWNYLRGPYDVKHPPRTGSAQDRGGRGLGIANPPVALDDQGRCWNRIFPHFQGNKTEMADRTSQAIRKNMTKAERGHYRTLVDYFGGGGCWGLYHALTNFPNVKNLVINEWEQGRLTKIRLLHELDGAVADMARDILIGTRERYEKTYRACLLDNGQETGSGATIANKVTAILDELLEGRGEDARGVLFAFIDCAHTMLTNRTDESGAPSFDAGVEAILANLKEDGKKAKEAADALKARGGNITYRQGDAASFDDAPHGDDVMTVCDPPYYLTAGYNGQVSVPLDTDMGWSYRTTQRLLDKLVDSGDGIVYTDEAWWHKEGYTPDLQGDMFSGGRSTFDQEQEVLLGIINSLDHFDVAGRVAGRQEVLGVHHGHTVGRGTLDGQAAVGADGGDVRPDVSGEGADASGSGSVRSSVRRVGRGVEGEDRAARRDYRGGRRGGYADRVIARETCVQAIVDALDGALGDYADDSSVFGEVAREAASQVRDDRLADYAQFVGEHVAGSKDGEIFVDGELPIPNEMRKDASVPDVRFSVQMGKRAKEEARRMIDKYRPGIHGYLTNYNGKLMHEDDAAIEAIAAFDTPKERKAALYWFCKNTVRLPEDSPKIVDAIKTAERAKVDPFQFERPGDILDQYAKYRPVEPPINPDTVPELSDRREVGHGIVTYLVQDDKAGQAAMRRILNTHFGKDASPWCLLQGDGQGGLSDSAWSYWNHYNSLPKRVAFKDGKLISFMATDESAIGGREEAEIRYEESIEEGEYIPDKEAWIRQALGLVEQWWDRRDQPHEGIPFTVTDDNGHSLHQELLPDGTVNTYLMTRGDARNRNGTYEEWGEDGSYSMVRREDGELVESQRIDANGTTIEEVLREYYFGSYERRLDIGRNSEGMVTFASLFDSGEGVSIDFNGRNNMMSVRLNAQDGYEYVNTQFADQEQVVQGMREAYEACRSRDYAYIHTIIETLKSQIADAQDGSTRFSVRLGNNRAGDYGILQLYGLRREKTESGYGPLYAGRKVAGHSVSRDNLRQEILSILGEDEGRAGRASAQLFGTATQKTVRALFTRFNRDEEVARIFERVWPVVEKFGLKFSVDFWNDPGVQVLGAYFNDGTIRLYANTLLDLPANRIAETILHESIHGIAAYVMDVYEGRVKNPKTVLSDEQRAAAEEIARIYEENKDVLDGLYAAENAQEMLSELSNPVLRERLQSKGIWDRIVAAVARFFGIATDDDAYAQLVTQLDRLIAAADTYTLGEYYKDYNRNTVSAEALMASGALTNAQRKVSRINSWRSSIQTSRETEAQRFSVSIGMRGMFNKDHGLRSFMQAMAMIPDDFDFKDQKLLDEVYVKTGWWRGSDKQWRIEIGDIKPKRRVGKSDARYTNGLIPDSKGLRCYVGDICSNKDLFSAYPVVPNIIVRIVDPDSIDFGAEYDAINGEITLDWDSVAWINDEPSNILNEKGVKDLTHEIQHAVQVVEGFETGGNTQDNPDTYWNIAGEVEARNAESRIGLRYDKLVKGGEAARRRAIRSGYAPWQTQDVADANQFFRDENGGIVDYNGRPVRTARRHSVRMGGNRRGYNAEDLVKGYTAAKILAGKEVTPEDVDKIAKMLGKTNLVAADILTAARATAERKTRSASFKARAADATLMSDLADDALRERVGKQIDDAIITGAGISDPDVGAAVQEAANRYATKSLDAAKGFTAREMEQKLPISLADAIFAEAEYARSPEEQAKLDEMKRKREEEREAEKKAAEELGMSLAEYRLMQAEQEEENTVYTEPSAEQKAYLNAIMDRARMRKELNDADEARRQARRQRQQNEGEGEGEGETDLGEGGEGGEGADEGILPRTVMRRIAPIFGSADMFALFLTEWCADEIVRKHPEIPNTDQMWKNRTAIKELVRTAQNILGDLASDVLGRPSVNAERNYADRAILGLAERKSYRGILREIAYVYDMIHDRALKMSRKTLIRDLVKDIRTKAAVKGRFKATTEKWQRGIDARTEMWARHLLPIIQMNEERLATEKARLAAIVNEYNRDSADNGYEADNFQEYRDACDKLALMEKYGAMKTWMPSRIIPAAQEIRDELNGRRAEFEAYRLQRDEANERIRSALVKAMEAGGTEAYRKAAGSLVKAMGRYGASFNGNLTLEMRNLVRYCKDEEARKAALDAIEELAILIGQASETYRVTLGTAHKEVNEGLEQIYGSAEKALKHLLEEKIPEEVAVKIFNQSRQELPTYGQLLQLYASCLQADYKDNLEKHNRANQLELMKATLTDQDLQLHAWAIDWYANNRQALSDAVDAITGLSVASPDRLYCPVRVLREPSGFPVEALAWSPVPSALNRRVSHGLDFDERYNFLTLLQEQCEVRAQLVGYGEAGIRLRDTIAHHDVQAAAAKYVSRADIKAVTDHVRDVLTQGIEAKSSDAFFKPLNVARKWVARFYLSGNLPSALKQLASRPVWANEVGFRKAAEYYLSAFTPEGWARVRELVDTDGYRARYMLGWSEETQNIIRNPSKNKLLKYLGKFYDVGMWVNKGVDMLSCLWMAQGFYGDAKQRFLDLGFSEEDAKAKAASLTWSVCENGQQSGRIENLNRVQREHPESAGALLQFMTAYLLQNNYEIQAAKECYAGTPGAKGRLLRAIVINHILIPGFVAMVEMAWHAVMGVEPPEDPEEWSQYTKDLVYSMALGPAAPLYMWSQIGTGLYDKLTGRKRKGGNRHTTPAEGILEIGDKVGTLIYNAGKYGLQEFTALDFEEELTVEQLQDDLLRAASAVYAPARHAIKAIKNREE